MAKVKVRKSTKKDRVLEVEVVEHGMTGGEKYRVLVKHSKTYNGYMIELGRAFADGTGMIILMQDREVKKGVPKGLDVVVTSVNSITGSDILMKAYIPLRSNPAAILECNINDFIWGWC